MSDAETPPVMVGLEMDSLLEAIKLLDESFAPKVTFCGNYESMKEEAIDQMKIAISGALELLRRPLNL